MIDNKNKPNIQAISDDEMEAVSGGDIVKVNYNGTTTTFEYSCPKCGCKDLRGITDGETFDKLSVFYKEITDHVVICRNCGYTAKGGQFKIKTSRETQSSSNNI